MISDNVAEKFGRVVTAHPWKVILFAVLLAFLAGVGGRFLQFTNDYRVFFGDSNPQLNAFDELENTYTKSDNVLITLAPESGDVFDVAVLAAVQELTEQSWQIPYSLRVDSITNYQHSYAESDDLTVRDLVEDAQSLTEQELEYVRQVALNEPLLTNLLVSPDSAVTAVNITVQMPGVNPTTETPEVVVFVRDMLEAFEKQHPDIDVYLTGVIMLNNAFAEASQNDMSKLIPISFLIVALSIGLVLRGWTATVTAVWVIALSIITAMGIAGWMGIKLTPPSAAAPTIILTMAVADSIHLLVTFFQVMRKGLAKRQAMIESMRINLQPVFVTSITTTIGFLTLNFSDSPPFHDLGNIVAVGVMAAFVFSVTFLPALMMLLPVKVKTGEAKSTSNAMAKLADMVIRRRGALLFGMGAVIICLVAFIPRNELNDVFIEYFDHSIPFRGDTEFTVTNLTGLYRLDYSLPANGSGAVNEPAYMRKVEAFADWFRKQPRVIHVNSFTEIMKRLNSNMHGDDPDMFKLPEHRELAAQYLLLYEMSLPYGLDLNNQVNVDKSATRFNVSMKTMSVNDLLKIQRDAKSWLENNAPELVTEGSGPAVMFSHITKRNIKSMMFGTSLALVLISIILIFALRSTRIGLISLIPNLVPAAMTIGMWGLLVGEIGLALSVVMSMTLGIIVDDTVHFLSKYQRARTEKNLDTYDSVRYAFTTVGTALWFTSLILAAGFLVLAFSAFKVNAQMGMLTAITIMFALAADFLFLPPVLMKIEERKHAKTAAVIARA